jgi:hypothetical protein
MPLFLSVQHRNLCSPTLHHLFVHLVRVVTRSLESDDLCHFVRALELVLLYFIARGGAPPHTPPALSAHLRAPVEAVGGSLVITLQVRPIYTLSSPYLAPA